jgi:hypothetical protein
LINKKHFWIGFERGIRLIATPVGFTIMIISAIVLAIFVERFVG